MICIITKVNLGVGDMRFMFCDVFDSQKKYTSPRDINSTNLPCLISVLQSSEF